MYIVLLFRVRTSYETMPIYQYCKETILFPIANINLTTSRLTMIMYKLVKETLKHSI